MLYPIMNIVAPLLLLAALVYVFLRTRKRSAEDRAVSEAGARRLREELNAEDQTGGSG